MIRIIHLSDLHIGKDILIPFPEHEARRKKLLKSVAAAFRPPDATTYLLVTGDIVDDGTRKECQKAQQALGVFEGRVLVCPGNHDYGRDGMIFEEPTVGRFLGLSAAVSAEVAPVEQGGGYSEENGVYHWGERVLRLKGIDVILHGHSGEAVQIESILGSKRSKVRTMLKKKAGVSVERIGRTGRSGGAVRVDANACVDEQKWVQIDIDKDGVHSPQIMQA